MFKADVSCAGMTDGNAGVAASGGVGPYTYLWSTGATTSTIGNLGPGTYTVTVTDNAGTVENNGVNLKDLDPIKVELNVTDGICGRLGKIAATVTGGIGPFQYDWNNGSFASEIQDLDEGEYSVTVTDRGSCDTPESAAVLVFGEGLALNASFLDPSCVGAMDGNIAVSQTGGQLPITYTWNNGNTSTTLENLGAGMYSISAVDALGCNDGFVIILRDPDQLVVELINQNNSLFAKVEGGNPPYKYEWSNGVTGSAVISNLASGEYYITVTDNNECEANDMADVLGPLSAADINEIESFQLFPNIVHSELNVQLRLLQSENVSFEIFSTNGQLLKSQEIYGQNINQGFSDLSNLQTGLFFLRISSDAGWSFTEKFIKQ